MGTDAPRPSTPGRSPLWATLTLTWVNNLGAAAALIGVYSVAESAFSFSDSALLVLGLLQGVTYIAAAALAGRGTRRLAGPGRAMSTRTLLAVLMVLMAGLALLPWLTARPWAVWVLVGVYSPLSGWLWPLVESYVSAQRHGDELRRATGGFNMSWASSQVVTFWALAPFMAGHPLLAIAVLGMSHVLCLGVLAFLPREPGAHDQPEQAHDPAEAARLRRLLGAHRVTLVLSYVLYSALNPLLPSRAGALGVDATWLPPLISVWMTTRVVLFAIMQRWHAWHGRGATLAWSAGALLGGFVLAMLAPGVGLLILGLAIFGVGMGATYAAAFHYAMEVGAAGVDAGGKHEALIGVGYSAGPLAGLAATGLVASHAIGAGSHSAATAAIAGGLACAVGAGACARLLRPGPVAPDRAAPSQ